MKKFSFPQLFNNLESDVRTYAILNFYFEKSLDKIDEKDILDLKEKLLQYINEDYNTFKFIHFLLNIESILIDNEKKYTDKFEKMLKMTENSFQNFS